MHLSNPRINKISKLFMYKLNERQLCTWDLLKKNIKNSFSLFSSKRFPEKVFLDYFDL